MRYTFKIDTNDGKGLRNINEYYNTSCPFIGFSDLANLNEELDSAYLEVISDNPEIPALSYIEYTCDNVTKRFYVGNDNVEKLEKNGNRFLHKLELVEITKKLEKKVCETICFTQEQTGEEIYYNLWDVLNRLWRIYEVGEDDDLVPTISASGRLEIDKLPLVNNNKIIGSIDKELENQLKSIEAPTLVLSNLTLREAFDEVFRYVNAIAQFKDRYTLSCEFFNKLKNAVDYLNKVDGFSSGENIDGYATQLQSFIENGITHDTKAHYSIVYPNDKEFDILRTNDANYSINETNCGVLLNNSIYNIDDIRVYTRINIFYGGKDQLNEDVGIPLKDFIVEDEVYNKLKFTTIDKLNNTSVFNNELYKINTIHYAYRSNFVDFSANYKGFLFNFSSSSLAIVQATAKYIINNWDKYSIYFSDANDNVNVQVGGSSRGIGSFKLQVPTDPSDITQFKFKTLTANLLPFEVIKVRTYYNPILDTRLTLNKSFNEGKLIDTSSIFNQSAKIISLQNISNNMKSKIDRIGNYEYTITIRHKNISEVFKKGDFIQDKNNLYVVVVVETIYYNDFIVAKYMLTKNYTRISEFIGINSEIRQWQIPNNRQSYDRVIKKESYCYVKLGGYHQTDNAGYTTTLARLCLQHSFETKEKDSLYDNVAITNVLYRSEFDTSKNDGTYTDIQQVWREIKPNAKSLLLECTNDSTRDSLIFNFGFRDNVSSGYYVQRTDNHKSLMTKIPYCSTSEKYLGFARNCDFNFINSNAIFETDILPLVNIDSDSTETFFNIPKQLILKDPAEILKFTFQLNFINKSINNVIFGNYMNEYNNLVYNGKRETYLYFENEELDKSDIYLTNGTRYSGSPLYDTSFNIVNEGSKYSITFSDALWAKINSSENKNVKWLTIGTLYKQPLISFKHTFGAKETLYFSFSDKRNDLVEKY